MAPTKSLVLAALLIVVATAGQVPRCAGLGASTNTSVLISGVVPCGVGSSVNLATVPVFPGAAVQLVCSGKQVVASATADGNGVFVFTLPYVAKDLLTTLLSNVCKVVVTTPLGACDKSLAGAAGTLTAPLKLLGLDTGSGSGGLGGLIGGIVGGIVGGVGNIVTPIVGIITGVVAGGLLNLGTAAFSLV